MGRGLNRIVAVAANTYRETVRERILYNLVFFAILMTLSGLLLGQLSIRQDEKIIKEIGLSAIEIFGSLIAIFLGVGLVSKEIERRSLYPLLAKPLTRDEFYLGKFVGLAFTLLVNVAVMAGGLFLTLWATHRTANPRLLNAIYPTYLGLLLMVALAMLLSTLTSSTLAAIGTVGLAVAGRFSDIVRNMHEVAPNVPGWFVDGLYYAVPNFRNFDFKDRVVYGDPVAIAALGYVSLYAFLYIGLALGLGLAFFRAKDFK
jgi:ABC-type transport system involved in multi-copper enzyme maturation permease subunit